MMFRSLMEIKTDNMDAQLGDLQRQIKGKIEKATIIAEGLQSTANSNDYLFARQDVEEDLTFKKNGNYKEMYWKAYLKNQLHYVTIKEMDERIQQLKEVLKEIENLQEDYFRLFHLKNRKKNRRLAVEIEKKFQCPYENCEKNYGSDVSLNLHIKIKHNGGNKTDREKIAEQICLAEVNGSNLPESAFNLPPGYVEEYKRLHLLKKSKHLKY